MDAEDGDRSLQHHITATRRRAQVTIEVNGAEARIERSCFLQSAGANQDASPIGMPMAYAREQSLRLWVEAFRVTQRTSRARLSRRIDREHGAKAEISFGKSRE